MAADKEFLTYNQQMKKLRDKKKIDCGNTKDKTTLVLFVERIIMGITYTLPILL